MKLDMGIDTSIAVVDGQLTKRFTTELVTADLEKFTSIFEMLSERNSDHPGQHKSYLLAVKKMHALLTELEQPPEVNSIDLTSFYYSVAYYPVLGNRQCIDISLIRNTTVMRKVPGFLASRSSEATRLWSKLMEFWNLNRRHRRTGEETYEVIEPPYELQLGDETYLVEPEGNTVGYLQGEELDRLATELQPHLPEVNEFYDSLRKKERRQADWAAPVELVYALATCYGGRPNTILLTHTD